MTGIFFRILPFALLALLAPSAHAQDPRFSGVNDLVYLLQLDSIPVASIVVSQFDLVVMDYSADGGESGEFSAADIAAIKASGKIALAYMSIGEAEPYRFYWDSQWDDDPAPDPDAPGWLGPSNPEWPDNYKVRYWKAGWQNIIFGTASGPDKSYLDRVIDQGFDGIYLDIVDAFEFWADEPGAPNRLEARTDMAAFILAMREYARTTRGISDFLVFPQNAAAIIYDNDENLDALGMQYLAGVDGIGAEDVFYDELSAQPGAEVTYVTTLLDLFREGGKRLVLSTDYVWKPNDSKNAQRYNDYKSKCEARGYIPFAAWRNRDLDEILTVAKDSKYLYPQPAPNEAAATLRDYASSVFRCFDWQKGRANCGADILPALERKQSYEPKI